MRRALPLAVLAASVLLLGAKGCNPSCADLTKALEAAKHSGNAQAIAAAGWALAEAGCSIEAPPPATCPDGLPPPPGGCPTTCADLACQYGCTEVSSGAVCLPAPDPDPSPVCAPGDTCGCWHRPPGEAWQKLPPCPVDPPPVDPPPPSAGCSIDGEPGALLEGHRPALGGEVNAAMTALKPSCSPGSRCVITDTRQGWQARVVAELRRRGLCAGQHTPETDEIAASSSSTAPREGWHVYAGPAAGPGTVVWSPGASRPAYAAPAGPPPPVDPPPVDPPSVAGCPAPVTPKVTLWGLAYRNKWWDSTPKFFNGDTATWTGVPVASYCAAIGMPDRAYCPARPEGDPNRRACEGVGIGGYANATPLWRCEQGTPEINEANPFQARCAPGWVEVCATDGTNCTRATP